MCFAKNHHVGPLFLVLAIAVDRAVPAPARVVGEPGFENHGVILFKVEPNTWFACWRMLPAEAPGFWVLNTMGSMFLVIRD